MKSSHAIARAVRLVGITLLLGGVVVGCYEGFEWLRTGRNDPMVLSDGLVDRLPQSAADWLRAPRSWTGLHRIAVWVLDVPMFAIAAMVGFLILLSAAAPKRT